MSYISLNEQLGLVGVNVADVDHEVNSCILLFFFSISCNSLFWSEDVDFFICSGSNLNYMFALMHICVSMVKGHLQELVMCMLNMFSGISQYYLFALDIILLLFNNSSSIPPILSTFTGGPEFRSAKGPLKHALNLCTQTRGGN